MFLSDICDPKRLPRKHQSELIEEEQQESGEPVIGRRPPIVDSIDFLYIDEEYLAVNKPADVRMDGDFDVTVTKLVYRKLESEKGTTRKPRFVHRLDYATSGVLIAGLMDQSASYLAKLFRERLVEKFYLALVHGWTPCKKFVMEERIANHPVDGFMMTVSADRGKSAKTECVPLSFGIYGDHYLVTKVLLKPFTGRRHQLRVHMKYRGFPIVGDATYGVDSVYGPDDVRTPPRMMLHAWKLKVLRGGGEELWIEAPDPFESCFMELANVV
ncbi:ribosomal large subunit pseudouridine synthase A [Galdieria sulphuraria]|uniref:Ribosomal large subunit pseudouridine synthase A n=1 Tax=Galdieria sulphuraria TaxID=130081 RepID=M2W3S7_GALSU|nr:ribosomal large subunit pseudouridine synthase A [Galdieria sulphuraria]EME30361.1 ribosomal large subunit pseudouridine synthase A [Galdieria sulphuraria]|eukprot:XP_005706881.1 ribosomal large subunit pseudouridine synthase A [Galdieria sulphuraria]